MYEFGALIDHQKVKETTIKCFVTAMVAATAKAVASNFFLSGNNGKEWDAYSKIFLFGADVFGGMTFALISTNLVYLLWGVVIRFEKIRSTMK